VRRFIALLLLRYAPMNGDSIIGWRMSPYYVPLGLVKYLVCSD